MIQFKIGVNLKYLNPILWDYLKELEKNWDDDIIITSVNDGTHSKTSLHYDGMAVDLRTKHLDIMKTTNFLNECRRTARIRPEFIMIQVVDEIKSKQHIHVEMDRKQGQII